MSESQTDRQKRFQELFLETLSNHYFEYFNLKTDQELLDDLHYGAYTTEGHVARKAYSLLKKEEEESQQKKETPKERWRAEKGEVYYFFDGLMKLHTDVDDQTICDDMCWQIGNYFQTREQAEAAAQKVKDLLLSLHNS